MEKNVNRRRFLGAAIGTGAAAAMAPNAIAHGHSGPSAQTSGGRSVPRNRRGIQLYTMREKMTNQDEARDVLHFLGRNGYTEVETEWLTVHQGGGQHERRAGHPDRADHPHPAELVGTPARAEPAQLARADLA